MPYEQREVAPAHVPLGEGYERSDLRGPNVVSGDREIALMPVPGVYKGRDISLCRGNEDTCRARRAKGTEFCAGHLRSIEAE